MALIWTDDELARIRMARALGIWGGVLDGPIPEWPEIEDRIALLRAANGDDGARAVEELVSAVERIDRIFGPDKSRGLAGVIVAARGLLDWVYAARAGRCS